MEYYGNLKKKLKLLAFRQIIMSLMIVLIVLIGFSLITNSVTNQTSVNKSNEEIRRLYKTVIDANTELLHLNEIDSLLLDGDINEATYHLNNRLNRFNNDNIVNTNVMIYDQSLEIIYASFSDVHDVRSRASFTKGILNSLFQKDFQDTYHSVYTLNTGFSDLMISRRIYLNDQHIGYATAYISGYDWSYYLLSNYNTDSIITDLDDNIIFYTRPLLLENQFKFSNVGFRARINQQNYFTSRYIDSNQQAIIYTLIPRQEFGYYIYLILLALVIGVLWYKNSSKLTHNIIDKNIESVNLLLEQIEKIQTSDSVNRIKMSTEDEYEIIEKYINDMLDRLDELNRNNTELLELSNTIEIRQLQLQYHPHFLYNTLEIIRFSIAKQPELAENLILQLTNVLKYSIAHNDKDVELKKDMKYIIDYLKIQKARFTHKFEYTINIDEDTLSCIVPKLILQPVIENSIKFGFAHQHTINLNIDAKLDHNKLILTVTDDGPGMTNEEMIALNKKLQSNNSQDSSIGLYNIARRLQLQYSDTSGVIVTNNNPGLKVTIIIDQTRYKEDLNVL